MSEQPTQGTIPTWTVGDRMGKALDHAEMSVADMAEYLGVHRNTLSGYINARRQPPRQTLMLWAMRTGVPLEWIETGEGHTTPEPPRPGRRDESALAALIAEKSGRGSTAGYSRFVPSLPLSA